MKTERLPYDDSSPGQSSWRTWLVRVGTTADPLAAPAVFPLYGPGIVLGRRDPDVAEGDPKTTHRIACDDRWMSRAHAAIVVDDDGWTLEDQGSANGTRVGGQKTSAKVLRDGDVIETGSTFWVFRHAAVEEPPASTVQSGPFASVSPACLTVVEKADRLARSNVPIMIVGETGTGKEVLARHIHAQSGREGPFIAINTAAVQPSLVASELFGVERGAHSMADRARSGQIRSAEGGTLLLDEIGDMPIDVQVTLLRVLQENEVLPVGGDSAVPIDVRFLCATHQPIADLVAAGRFRADLQARLQGTTLRLPTLRERREDIGLLIGTFLRRLGAPTFTLTPAAFRALMLYDWPRNVRELEKALQAAIALCPDDRLELTHFPEAIQNDRPPPAREPVDDDDRRKELLRLLSTHRGNISAVARSMGYSRMQVHRWLKHYGIDADSFRSAGS